MKDQLRERALERLGINASVDVSMGASSMATVMMSIDELDRWLDADPGREELMGAYDNGYIAGFDDAREGVA